MKTKLIALALVGATAFSLTPKPAVAGDREIAAIGGFIGGLIVGSVINDRHPDSHHSTVIVDRHDDRGPSGYWKEVTVKTWVPARWVIERDRRNCETRRYVAGYYDYCTNRVWVSTARHSHRDYEVSRGYGHRR